MAPRLRADTPPEDNPPPVEEDAAPVTGEATTVDAIVPSEAEVATRRSSAKARTGVQVGAAVYIVTLLCWFCALRGWDLDPDPKESGLPEYVASAFTGAIGYGFAVWMNRTPKPPKG